MTWSPTDRSVAVSGPISSSTPANSMPGTYGRSSARICFARMPARRTVSVGLTAAARTRIRTSPGPATGSGSSTSCSTSGPPNSVWPIAFMLSSNQCFYDTPSPTPRRHPPPPPSRRRHKPDHRPIATPDRPPNRLPDSSRLDPEPAITNPGGTAKSCDAGDGRRTSGRARRWLNRSAGSRRPRRGDRRYLPLCNLLAAEERGSAPGRRQQTPDDRETSRAFTYRPVRCAAPRPAPAPSPQLSAGAGGAAC